MTLTKQGGSLWASLGWSLGLCLLVVGCDSGNVGGNGKGDGGPAGDGIVLKDAAGDAGAKKDVGAPKPCTPPCTLPQTCSHVGICLDPGTCAHDVDCPTGFVCDLAQKKCVVDGQCGSTEIGADVVPPNMLIVLDRSCSMRNNVAGTGTSKWAIAVDAISKLLTKNTGKIRFGLTLFPDTLGNNCKQEEYAVPLGPNKEAVIDKLLKDALVKADPNYPDGPCVTNIDTAMEQASLDKTLEDASRGNFVLLIGDGAQAGCNAAGGDNGTTQIITNLYQNKNVATFVVGFGSAVDAKQLNIFADAGGKPSGDPTTHFYKAEDQASLDAALTTIAKKTFGCIYKLGQAPPDLDKIFVFFDSLEIKQDKTKADGWDYDATTNTVTFYGQACKDLEGNKVQKLSIIYGCKPPTPDGGIKPGGDGGGGCSPGRTPCSVPKDCPDNNACLAGCCTPIIN